MRKEFDSELAKEVSGQRKRIGKAWIAVAFCAAILVSGAAAVTAVAASNGDQTKDQIQDKLQDGSCDETDCDGTPDQDQIQDQLQDGSCEETDCDGVCDYDTDGDGICDNQETP